MAGPAELSVHGIWMFASFHMISSFGRLSRKLSSRTQIITSAIGGSASALGSACCHLLISNCANLMPMQARPPPRKLIVPA
ncbi:unnamed protein product [Mycena citricolor]|uniref:Uncharacterized protein n=1 Tax=Mycena citricolor TaxID=2018698 RepID=A0AAD2HQY3_9AGAR|nr:unnamed protein product [Mycena citricolor]